MATRSRTLLLGWLLWAVAAWPAFAGAAEPKKDGVAPKGEVVVLFTPWRDPTEGAFTVNVPQGWKVTGGTSRKTNVNVRHHVRAVSPGGGMTVFIGDPSLLPNQVPDQMSATVGLHEGQVTTAAWGGQIRIARFQTGEQYARGYVVTNLCRGKGTSRTKPLEDATRELAARAADYGRATNMAVRAAVGEAAAECGRQRGYVRAATLLAGPAHSPGAAIWDVLELGGYGTSDPSAELLARYVLDAMVASFRLDPGWEQAQAKALRDTTGAVTRSQQQMATSIADRARQQARSSQVDVMSGWVKRNQQRDAAMQRSSEARRGTTTVEDPVLGTRTVGNQSSYYWTRPDGSIVGTNTDTPPDYSSGWRQMTVK